MPLSRRLLGILLVGVLLAAACSSKNDDATTTVDPEPTAAEADGSDEAADETPDEAPDETSDETSNEPVEETPDATEETPPATGVLGEPNPATDAPILIGVVTDGETPTIDHTELLKVTKATVEYANEFLGGINGHVIELVECETDATPAGGTQCGVELAQAGVAAALVPASAQDVAVFDALTGSGIPYFTYTSAAGPILNGPGAFIVTNPISAIAGPGLIAQEQGIEKVGFILIDVPAATGPITAIATPIYGNLGVELDIIPISPQVADMTPAIQVAISGGDGLFSVTGSEEFTASAIIALDQLGFEGTVMSAGISGAVVDAIGDLTDGIITTVAQTQDPNDPDVQLFDAVIETYAADYEPNVSAPGGFATVLAFVRALSGATDAVDAASITEALSTMAAPVAMPLGGGITFQCGTTPVSFAVNICSTDVIRATFDAEGIPQGYEVLVVPAEVLALG